MSYSVPTAAELKVRYPAFSAVLDETIDYWIGDAQRIVTTSWAEADYQPGLMSLAAHNMALQGIGASGAAQLPAGVTQFRSGAMSISVSEAAANARTTGGYGATIYAQEFSTMLRRNAGGPRLVSACA